MDFYIRYLTISVPSSRGVAQISSKLLRYFHIWQELCHQMFLKSAKCSLSAKTNDKLQNLFWNTNLLIQNVLILMDSELDQFFRIKIWYVTM